MLRTGRTRDRAAGDGDAARSVARLEHALDDFEGEREHYSRRLADARRRLTSYESRDGGDFAFADELAEKRRQLAEVESQMHNKTDENDAAMLAELARTGFHLLRAREVTIKSRMNVENTIRGLLATFGICLPKHLKTYDQRGRKALEVQPDLLRIILPLLHLRTEALRQAAALTKDMVRQARADGACRRLMTIPGAGAVSAVTYVATIDRPDRFVRSRSVGAYIGLTSRRYQSGDVDYAVAHSTRSKADAAISAPNANRTNPLSCIKPAFATLWHCQKT